MPERRDASLRPEVGARTQPATEPFAVLYEDDSLLAVDKPAGLVVHPAYRHPDGTLFDAVLVRQTARGEARPCLLHRLDRDTSGVVLFAKTTPARRALVRQFERRQVCKGYLALVSGCPSATSGTITHPLRRDPEDRRRVIVDPTGQPAETRYRVLAADEDHALLLMEPRSGRTHQIRAHLAWLGHPLFGDATYAAPASTNPASAGSEQTNARTEFPPQFNCGALFKNHMSEFTAHAPATQPARHLLHAWALGVRHPTTGAPLRLVAPLPPDFAAHLPGEWRERCADALATWDEALDAIEIDAGRGESGRPAREQDDPHNASAGRSPTTPLPFVLSRLTGEPSIAPPNEEAIHASSQH